MVNIPGEDAYNVRVGAGVLDALGPSMRGVPTLADARQVLVITDANVGPLYLARAKASLAQAGYRVSDICVPAGEEAKSLTVLGEVLEAMAALALERDCVVVALGGGCVGDLAGFAAATYMRGVQVVQVPTTLLSMVDSSVGGKTGVNLSAGKNLVGAFKQPAFVCADTEVLATLPAREWACGCGEVAKTALIDGDEFFFWLSDQASAVVDRQPDAVSEAIARCVVFKADVVAQDKTESRGVRECLNYGHTLAHAIEKISGYGTYSHGHAVAEGMRFAVSSHHFTFVERAFLDVAQQVGSGRFDLVLNETQTQQIIDDVARCDSDLGVMYLSRANEGAVGRVLDRNKLEFYELFEAVPHVFLRFGHPLAGRESVSLEDLYPYPQLSFVQGAYESSAFSEEPLWAPSAKTVKVSDRGFATSFMLHSDAYTVTSGVYPEFLQRGAITAVPIRSGERMHIGYVMPRGLTLDAIGEAFVAAMKLYAKVEG